MNYQTIESFAVRTMNDVAAWVADNPTNALYVLAGIAVIGAVNGVRHSLNWCGHTRHTSRRVR